MNNLKRHRPMFYEKVVRPFIEPFADWFLLKISLFTTVVVAQVSGFLDLFETEIGYVYLLFCLVVLDAIGKTINIYFVEHTNDWDLDLFLRKTIYKVSSYIVVCLAFIMFSNQFESDTSRLEYGAYLGLSVLELVSIAGHFKLIGYLVAVVKQIATGKIDFEKLKEEAQKYHVKKKIPE